VVVKRGNQQREETQRMSYLPIDKENQSDLRNNQELYRQMIGKNEVADNFSPGANWIDNSSEFLDSNNSFSKLGTNLREEA